MEYQSQLKSNAWVDVLTLAEWLNLKEEQLDVSSGKAILVVGDLTFKYLLGGIEGNAYQIELTAGGTAGAEIVTNSATKLSIQIEDGVSTAQQIKDAFDAFVLIPNVVFVSLTISGTAGTPQNIAAIANLSLGTDPVKQNARLVKKLERLLNYAHDKIEAIIDCPVLAKTYVETKDGTSSNTIVPGQWPVQSITEIRIDYNRGFQDATILDPSNYFVRGVADRRQEITDTAIRIIGNDVVLRDDNEKYIVGRIFAGSSLGSIKITYLAGWAPPAVRTIDETEGFYKIAALEVPQDMALAAIHLAEWFYYQRENRDLGTTGKGVVGENYTKITNGIPNQIHEMLEQYVDCSFGDHTAPQRNSWIMDNQ